MRIIPKRETHGDCTLRHYFCRTVSTLPSFVRLFQLSAIVGYQGKATKGGNLYSFIVPTFQTLKAGGNTLADIKLDYEGDDPTGATLYFLSQGGATLLPSYQYVNEEAKKSFGGACQVGWWTSDAVDGEDWSEPMNNLPIPYGQGLALVSGDSSIKAVFSGSVKSDDDAYVDSKGGNLFLFTGNCMPVNYTLGDLSLVYDGDDPTGATLYFLSQGGATLLPSYQYVNEAAKKSFGGACEVGWWTSDAVDGEDWSEPMNNLPMNAGDGIALVTGDSSIQLKVPSPLKKK